MMIMMIFISGWTTVLIKWLDIFDLKTVLKQLYSLQQKCCKSSFSQKLMTFYDVLIVFVVPAFVYTEWCDMSKMAKSSIFGDVMHGGTVNTSWMGGDSCAVLGMCMEPPSSLSLSSWTELCFVPLPKGKEINSALDQVSPVIFPGTMQPVFWD